VEEIRGLAGTLMPEALVGSAGAFVTVSTFGEQAPAEAQLLGLTLVDGRDLLRPSGEGALYRAMSDLSDAVAVGSFLARLLAPLRGNGMSWKALGNEPGRALELLTLAA